MNTNSDQIEQELNLTPKQKLLGDIGGSPTKFKGGNHEDDCHCLYEKHITPRSKFSK